MKLYHYKYAQHWWEWHEGQHQHRLPGATRGAQIGLPRGLRLLEGPQGLRLQPPAHLVRDLPRPQPLRVQHWLAPQQSRPWGAGPVGWERAECERFFVRHFLIFYSLTSKNFRFLLFYFPLYHEIILLFVYFCIVIIIILLYYCIVIYNYNDHLFIVMDIMEKFIKKRNRWKKKIKND